MEQNQIDKTFKSAFENAENNPPSASWAQMEALLDAQNPVQEKKKRAAFWYWAAAALFPILIFSFWYSIRETGQNQLLSQNSGKNIQIKETDNLSLKPLVAMEGEPKNMEKSSFKAKNIKKGNLKINAGKEGENRGGVASLNLAPYEKNEEIKVVAAVTPELAVSNVEIQSTLFPKPLMEEKLTLNSITNENSELASIEFRPEKNMNHNRDQVASLEWKKSKPGRQRISERIENFRTNQLGNLPTIGEAKEQIFALLTPGK